MHKDILSARRPWSGIENKYIRFNPDYIFLFCFVVCLMMTGSQVDRWMHGGGSWMHVV
jgi:hypothetical protein